MDSIAPELDWYIADDKGEELVLSASSVTQYLRCPTAWEYKYVRRVRRPPSVRQALGLSAHTAFETNMLAKLGNGQDLREDVILDVFSDEFDERSHDSWVDPEDPIAKAKDQGVQVVSKQHTEIAPHIYPMMVEEPFQYRINGVRFSGTLDLADQKRRVRDWKVVARKPSGPGSYWLGMTGYGLGFRQKSGMIEAEVQLDIFQRHKRDPVSYYPIGTGQPMSPEMISTFANIVREVHDNIVAGRFPPNGLFNQACSYCDFRDICPAYRAAYGDSHARS